MLGLVVQVLTSVPPLVYLAIGLLTLLYLKTKSRVPANIPPFPVKPYPVLGHIPWLRKEPHITMNQWSERTGGIFSVYVGSILFVGMNSLDVLKEALVKKGDYFSDRPPSFILPDERKQGGRGILLTSGAIWKEQRTVSLSILRNLGMGKNWQAEKIDEEVKVYLDVLAGFKGQPQDVKILTNSSVSNVVCAILIGDRFELDDPYFTKMTRLITTLFALSNGFSPVHGFPFLKYLPGDLFNEKKMKQNTEDIMEHFSLKFVKEKDAGDHQDNPQCFINAYYNEMRQREKAGQPTTLNEFNLAGVVTNLFFAGTETTSTTLLWAMLFAIRHPECQEKILKEIQEHVGSDRHPSIQDRPKLTYTNAFIMETQRLGSIAPLAFPHYCNETVEVAGYTIPKGTMIMPNLNQVLKDPKTWGDPLVFRPERFLDADGKLTTPEEFIPFSIGRRYCLGESLARMELFLYITGIFQRFHLQPEDPNDLPPEEGKFGLSISPLPFKLRFVERKENS